jgi:tetratricopeptide (TPR) repeat protein
MVCGAGVNELQSLIEKSLIRVQDERFSMLATIREYAADRLTELTEADDARRRHADYLLSEAEAHRGEYLVEMTASDLDWFEREHDNLRAALDWLDESAVEPELEVRLAGACQQFWIQRGYWTELRKRSLSVLERARGVPDWLRARALHRASQAAWHQGDYERAQQLAEAALALHREIGTTEVDRVPVYQQLASCQWRLGNRERAGELFELAATGARLGGADYWLSINLSSLGNLELERRDFARARTYLAEAVDVARRLRWRGALANNLADLGIALLGQGDVGGAAASFRESLGIRQHEPVTADILVCAIEGLAAVAIERGAPIEACRLLAATTRPRVELGSAMDLATLGDEIRARVLEAARAKLDEGTFAAAWAEGEALSLEGAAETAATVVVAGPVPGG